MLLRTTFPLVFILITTACTTARIDVARHSENYVSGDEGIVILARQQDGGHDTEESFMECVTEELSDASESVRIFPEQEFVDSLFPWFEARTAPSTLEALPALLSRPGVSERLEDIGVRYLVWVSGNSERVDGGGGMSCAVGPGGGGCFGFVWWDTASLYEAAIWDLKHGKSVGAVSADASGMSYVPALVIPVPMIARTKTAACKGLVEQLAEFLDGRQV